MINTSMQRPKKSYSIYLIKKPYEDTQFAKSRKNSGTSKMTRNTLLIKTNLKQFSI